MSSKPAQSSSLERVASRRNVIRSAAWTTAAVTVVVATPNIAAASPGDAAAVTCGATSSYAKGQGQAADTVTWTITIQNTGNSALNLAGTFGITNTALLAAPAGLTVTSTLASAPGTTTWAGTSNTTRTYTLPKGATATVTVKFSRQGNGNASGQLSASFVSGSSIATNLGGGSVAWARV